jgi:DNA-binding IclR family transcriptional regulator
MRDMPGQTAVIDPSLPGSDEPEREAVPERYRIQAIERAFAILDSFTADEPELGLTELAGRVGLHKSTVHRFMVNLEAGGFVERSPRSGRFRLGLRVLELGGLVMQRMNLWEEALPFLEELVGDTGETGHLAVLEDGEAIYIERVEARRALRINAAVGTGYPAHATNLGKVLLADLPTSAVSKIVDKRGLARFTPNTITTRIDLDAELERIREQGFGIDDEEYDEGLRCIGAPVFDHSGRAIAALGIGGPANRVTPERVGPLAERVLQAAGGLSRRLGALPGAHLSQEHGGTKTSLGEVQAPLERRSAS